MQHLRMEITSKLFAAAIRKERKRLNLSQDAAAKLCKVHPNSWNKWEHEDAPLWITMQGVLALLTAIPTPK